MLRLNLRGDPAAPCETGAETRRAARKIGALVREEKGQTLVEFALVLPILLILVMGIITFAIAFWNQLTLTNATNAAAQVAAVQRSAVAVDVCNPVNTALYNASTGINNPGAATPLTFSIGTAPSGSTATPTPLVSNIAVKSSGVSACATLLSQGEIIKVSTSYGCNLNFFGFRLASACKLSSNTTEAVQ